MINLESEITIPLNEENEEEIDENFPISKNHLSNFNRASYSDNEKIGNEFELYNQIFDTDNLLNNNKDEEEYYDEEKFFNELYMTKDNSKSITGPLSQKTEQLKEDIKINPNEKNRIYKIYNTKDIKKILRENNFPVKIIEKINEIYINDEDKQSINIFKFKNKRIRNKITIKTKRTELGRKRKKDTIKGIHNMYSADNILKKIKGNFFRYGIDFLNMFLNKNNQKGELLYLNYKKYINNLTKKKEIDLFKMKLKDFASLEVSKKKKSNSDIYFNKNSINHILKDTEKNNETIQNFLNNISFEEWIDVFTKKRQDYNLEEFNGLQNSLEKVAKEYKDDDEYFTRFVFYLFNYSNWFYNKKGRERK